MFRQLHPVALERFCERILTEVGKTVSDSERGFYPRYQEIYTIIEKRDKEVARLFDDLRRSTALFQIAALHGQGLLTDEEFQRFGPETRASVNLMLGRGPDIDTDS